MTRDELIKSCRYYDGKPFDNHGYEHLYEEVGDDEETKANKECLSNRYWFHDMERVYVSNILRRGIFGGEYRRGHGPIHPQIPYDLLDVMFTSWAKWEYDPWMERGEPDPRFKEIIDVYLSGCPIPFPEKLPR